MAVTTALFLLQFVFAVLLTENLSSASVFLPGDRDARSNCMVDPCQVTQCFAYPDATCIADYTQGCDAKFYVRGTALTIGQCDGRPGGRILRDDTESRGPAPNLPDPSRRRSPPPSSNRRPSGSNRLSPGSSRSTGGVDSLDQRILVLQRQAEVQRRKRVLENEMRFRQQNSRPSNSRTRSNSRNRSRGRSGMGNRNRNRSQNNRSRSSRRGSLSGGFLSRLLRG